MAQSHSDDSDREDGEALYFSPKTSSEHSRGISRPRNSSSAAASASHVPARRHLTEAGAPARETSPLRGMSVKGKGRSSDASGYDSATTSPRNPTGMGKPSGSAPLRGEPSASTSRTSLGDDEDDETAAVLSYGAGFDAREHLDSERIPALHRFAGGSHKTLDGTLPQHLPGSKRSADYLPEHSAYSTVELQSSDKSAMSSGLDVRISSAQRKREYWRSAVINVALILSWYLFSTLISVYNKWMFSTAHYKFSYPLFVTSAHMIMQFVLSGLMLLFCGDRFVPRQPNGQRARPNLQQWTAKIVPCALATAIDIGLSNLSLKTITLTFYTMCKSSNLAFVLLFAFLFRLEVIRCRLVGIIALITGGVIMMVAAETKFVLVGAVEVLTASAMGGLRWALIQLLLDKKGMGLNHPVATIFWLSPIMAVGLIVASLSFENWHKILGGPFFHGAVRTLRTLGLITLPGLLAFCMNLSEFALIQRTSVVTLSVAGIFKEVLTVIVASTIFGDELTPINITGLCITLVGIGLYNWLRYKILTKAGAAQNGRDDSRSGGYAQLGAGEFSERLSFDADDEYDGRQELGRSRSHSRSPSIAMSERTADLSDGEKERRRKREEEANMAGWATSGIKSTGNGLVDTDEE